MQGNFWELNSRARRARHRRAECGGNVRTRNESGPRIRGRRSRWKRRRPSPRRRVTQSLWSTLSRSDSNFAKTAKLESRAVSRPTVLRFQRCGGVRPTVNQMPSNLHLGSQLRRRWDKQGCRGMGSGGSCYAEANSR